MFYYHRLMPGRMVVSKLKYTLFQKRLYQLAPAAKRHIPLLYQIPVKQRDVCWREYMKEVYICKVKPSGLTYTR